MIKKKYLDILNNLSKTLPVNKSLVVDGTNTFIRGAAVNSSVNEHGVHTGAMTGFLLSIGFAIKRFNINKVYIVFDGKGGSVRRKEMYPEYKANRKAKTSPYQPRLFSTIKHEQEALKYQMKRLIEYLMYLPVTLVIADYIEADDAMTYIATGHIKDKNEHVYIMSTDQDFLQLVNENISIWSPTKKQLYTYQNFHEEIEIHPWNYINYKVLKGDGSDNISGIKGFGTKTGKKTFPFLFEEKQIYVSDIINHAVKNKGKFKVYDTILEDENKLELNYNLMNLDNIYLKKHTKLILDNALSKSYKFNKLQILKFILEDQINSAIKDPEKWLYEVWSKVSWRTKQDEQTK